MSTKVGGSLIRDQYEGNTKEVAQNFNTLTQGTIDDINKWVAVMNGEGIPEENEALKKILDATEGSEVTPEMLQEYIDSLPSEEAKSVISNLTALADEDAV